MTGDLKLTIRYAAYSNRARGQRRKAGARVEAREWEGPAAELPPPGERAALRRRWANLIRRVYEVDPSVCPRCGCEMRVVRFITEPGLIKRTRAVFRESNSYVPKGQRFLPNAPITERSSVGFHLIVNWPRCSTRAAAERSSISTGLSLPLPLGTMARGLGRLASAQG